MFFSVFVRLFNTFIILSAHLFSFSLVNHIFKVIPSNLSSGHKIHTLSTTLTFLTVFSIKCQAIGQKFCGFERGLNMFEIGITKNSKILFLQAKCQKSLQTKGPGQSWPEPILVEAVGFEPTSKSISERLSPSAADTLELAHVASRQQTTQSLSRCSLTLPGAHARFSCIIDARSVTCRWIPVDARCWTKQLVRNCYSV